MKTEIKHLAKEINRVLSFYYYSQQMNALIDCGEWSSGIEPDFKPLIRRFKLTRPQLLKYIEIADENAHKFFSFYPKENFKPNPYKGINYIFDINPWADIYQTLHCIFQAGELQE